MVTNTIYASNRMIFSTPEGMTYLNQFFKQVFSRAGIELVTEEVPYSRSFQMVNAGYLDGDLFRSNRSLIVYPNVIQIATKDTLWVSKNLITKKNRTAKINHDIAAYVVGLETNPQFWSHENINWIGVYSFDVLCKLILSERVDFALVISQGLIYSESSCASEVVFSESLTRYPVFMWIHKDHEKWIPAIQGAYDLYFTQFLQLLQEKRQPILIDQNEFKKWLN
jgi:hypothetical protein